MTDKSELLNQLTIDRDSEAPSHNPTTTLVVAAVFSALVGATLSWLLKPDAPVSTAAPQAAAQVKQIAPKDLDNKAGDTGVEAPANRVPESESILNASGYITARRMATVSSQLMGLIQEVNVEEGMEVNEGQILARLDDALVKVNLELAEAQVTVLESRRKSIQASLDEAERHLKRVKSNVYSSESQLTEADSNLRRLQADMESASADIQVARLSVKHQQERLADHSIRAPFSGVVTVKNAQPGEIVAPSSAGGGFTRTGICTIVDMQSLEIEVDVNESFIGRVFPGQRVEAKLDAYSDWAIPASVIAIVPTADRAKATVQVRIKIEDSDPRILPDMGVKVAFLKS